MDKASADQSPGISGQGLLVAGEGVLSGRVSPPPSALAQRERPDGWQVLLKEAAHQKCKSAPSCALGMLVVVRVDAAHSLVSRVDLTASQRSLAGPGRA